MLKIQKPWFIVVAPVAPAYAEPNFNSAKVTEAISGESVQILAQNRGWVWVEQDDGYKSWIREFYGRFDDDPFPATHMIINRGKFPFGMRVELIRENIITADGKAHPLDLKLKPLIQKSDPDGILEISQNLRGCPYRWGGKTSFGFDCSGFVQMVCLVAGIKLPRDSLQQFEVLNDYIIDGKTAKPGDLHFFGKNGKVTHVGFSTGGWGIIHCQGIVKEETLEKGYSNSNEKLSDIYISTHSIRFNFRS